MITCVAYKKVYHEQGCHDWLTVVLVLSTAATVLMISLAIADFLLFLSPRLLTRPGSGEAQDMDNHTNSTNFACQQPEHAKHVTENHIPRSVCKPTRSETFSVQDFQDQQNNMCKQHQSNASAVASGRCLKWKWRLCHGVPIGSALPPDHVDCGSVPHSHHRDASVHLNGCPLIFGPKFDTNSSTLGGPQCSTGSACWKPSPAHSSNSPGAGAHQPSVLRTQSLVAGWEVGW